MVQGITCVWKENDERKDWNMRRKEEKGKGDLPSDGSFVPFERVF